jgi:hypothetical protein
VRASKPIRWVIASVGVIAVLAASSALVLSRSRPGVTEEDFRRLEPGMTRAEVERRLHGPPRNDLKHQAIIWLPQADGRRISHHIEPVAPAFNPFVREDRPPGLPRRASGASPQDFFPRAKDGQQALWITRTGLIAVDFGPDGRLREKYHSTVHESEPPSLMGWLRSRR